MLSRSKLKLVCYKKSNLPASFIILPYFLSRSLYSYNGRQYSRIVFSSQFMLFFYLNEFLISKKIGPIHVVKESKAQKSSKKKK